MKEPEAGKRCSLLGCTGALKEGQRFCDSCIKKHQHIDPYVAREAERQRLAAEAERKQAESSIATQRIDPMIDASLEFRVIRREQVKKGDVLILTCPEGVTTGEVIDARAFLRKLSENLGVPTYLIPPGFDLRIVGADAVPSDAEHIDS
jgi:hypothetical protein